LAFAGSVALLAMSGRLPVMRITALGPHAVVAFADRADGVSLPPYDHGNLGDHVGDDQVAVQANRTSLAQAAQVGPDQLRVMSPTHGREVAIVDQHQPQSILEVDALVTATPGVALLVLAADCVPVLLADGEAGVVAVAHAGWRGVRADVTGATLAAMVELGARLDRTRALIGPAICGACYSVPRERYDDVVAVAPAAAAVARDGLPGLDLRAAVVDRLCRNGVRTTVYGTCTFESPDWFSFRRDPVTGRHGGVVVLSGSVS
jgi:YfiH family protein